MGSAPPCTRQLTSFAPCSATRRPCGRSFRLWYLPRHQSRTREASIYDISLICHIPLLLLIFVDIGAGDNHLLDLAVLERARDWTRVILPFTSSRRAVCDDTPIRLTYPIDGRPHCRGALRSLVTTTHLVVLVPDVYTAMAALRAGGNANHRPLEGRITRTHTILSETRTFLSHSGKVPVVTDRIHAAQNRKRHPDAVRALIERIDARSSTSSFSRSPIERTYWWERFHFGSDVIQAIDRSYDFSGPRKVITSICPRTSRQRRHRCAAVK
jgi:hypothetical protein